MLRAEGISKFYPRKAALKGVSVQFPKRGMVFIRGVSGSGKSTLMNILTASDYPNEGKVIYNGVEITKSNADSYRRSCVSEIYQDFLLLDNMSVKDNIAFAMQAAGGKADENIIKDILAKVGLLDCAGEKAIKLSGGEKQRVAIARALVKQGAMIFADEPTGNLDSGNAKAVMDILKSISSDRLVVVVSHNEAQSREYADITIDISDGEIVGNTAINVRENICENSGGWSAKKDGADIKTVFKLVSFNLGVGALKSVFTTIAALVLSIVVIFALTLTICDTSWAYVFTLNNSEYKNAEFYYYKNYEEIDKLVSRGKYDYGIGYKISNLFRLEYLYGDEIRNYSPDINKLVAFNDEKSFDSDILYGVFPKNATQLMIPLSVAESLFEQRVMFDGKMCDNLDELIGKHLTHYRDNTVNLSFEICGIFDDAFDSKQAAQLDETDRRYLEMSNNLRNIAVGRKELNDIIFDNYTIVDINYLRFYFEDNFVSAVGYNGDMNYADALVPPSRDEAYISRSLSELYELKTGDTFVLNTAFYKYYDKVIDWGDLDEIDEDEYWEKENITLKVKDIIEDKQICSDIIINNELYRLMWKAENLDNPQVMIAKSLWVNARGLPVYKLFRDMSHIDKFPSTLNSDRGIYEAYDKSDDFSVIFIPLVVISALALSALQCAAVNYQLSGKGKQFNVLRAIGFGKKSVRALMLLQAAVTSLIQCAVGIPLAGVICYFYGRGLIPAVSTEVPLPLGWHAALIGLVISMCVSLITAAVKCVALFKKSIVENGKS